LIRKDIYVMVRLLLVGWAGFADGRDFIGIAFSVKRCCILTKNS
jgi:hypothetical protein